MERILSPLPGRGQLGSLRGRLVQVDLDWTPGAVIGSDVAETDTIYVLVREDQRVQEMIRHAGQAYVDLNAAWACAYRSPSVDPTGIIHTEWGRIHEVCSLEEGEAAAFAGDISKGRPVVWFSRALHRFLLGSNVASSAAFDLLAPHRTGWTDGACLLLALALQQWLGPAAQLQAVGNTSYPQAHVVTQVGSWYLDGDGVSSAKRLLQRWHEVEHLPGATLRPYAAALSRDLLHDETLVAQLADLFRRRWNAGLVVNMLQHG